MLKKVCEFIIRQFQVKNRKDTLLLLLKLGLAYFILNEIYADFVYMKCLITRIGDRYEPGMVIFSAVLKRLTLVGIFYLIYRSVRYFRRKGISDIAAVVFVFISLITSLFCGSVLGIFYWDGPYLGRVVDADSGAPVAEASVVAKWSVEYISSPWTGGTSFADAREAVTDENGRFILPIGRTFWLWPFSRIMIDGISVFKSGYDSYPPRMQYSWNKDDMKIWQKKLNRLYPKHQGNIREVYKKIFTHNYLPARFEPCTIRLNQALTLREQLRVVRSCEISCEINGCNSHVRKRKNMVYEEKKRLNNLIKQNNSGFCK